MWVLSHGFRGKGVMFVRFKKAFAALLALTLCAFSAPFLTEAPASADEIAFVDVAQVIDSSAPGRAAQKYVDNLKNYLNDELQRFVKKEGKAKGAEQRVAQKQAELNAEYQREYNRVTSLVLEKLKGVVLSWIKANKKGVTAVFPADAPLAYSAKADISKEILKKFNIVRIDFTKK